MEAEMAEIQYVDTEILEEWGTLPAGYHMRPAKLDDVQATVKMLNVWAGRILGRDKFEVEDFLTDWSEPGFDLGQDARLVIAPDGQIAGYCEVFDPGEPHVRLHSFGRVHPDHTNVGVGSWLLRWAEERARQAVPCAPSEARVALVAHCLASRDRPPELFLRHGFTFVRHGLRMVIELDREPPEPVWPGGITVRPIVLDQDEPAMVQAVLAAFKDHWGFVERPFEEELARFQHLLRNNPNVDPALWYLAWDGDQIAGVSLCWPHAHDDHEMGWVGTLGVSRPWRRRGIALVLLQHIFGEFWRRGKRRVGLGVDAQSLTGATRLYEKAGMHSDPAHLVSIFEKELRPGVELSTQSVGD
jgi:mycothiol synthase